MRTFLRNSQGNVFILFALGAMAVIGAVGVAVDAGRAQMVQAKLQSAVDAAGLAAGATLNTTDLTGVATKYINLNFAQGNLGAVLGTVTSTLSTDKTIVTVSAPATLPTTFMRIFNKNSVTVSATTQVTRASKGMELVLVLDNTGSMNSAVNPSNSNVTKIAALRTAVAGTGGMLDILYGPGNNTVDNLWVGVVPFSQAVNIGTATTWTPANTLDWGVPAKSWTGCVMERAGAYDMTDDTPATAKFPFYYAATTGTVTTPISGSGVSGNCPNSNSTTNAPWLNDWKCTVKSNNKNVLTYDFSAYNPSSGLPNGLPNNKKGPNSYCPQQLMGMVAEKATVASTVNGLTAQGSTFINIGMAWGQRMLSPKWRGLWGGQMNANNLPLDYNKPLMNKVVVLMTDGMNSFGANTFTGYGWLKDNQTGSTQTLNTSGVAYSASAEKALNDRTLAMCNTLKANGVIIYTIGFGTDDSNNFYSSTSVNGPLLKACATSEAYYFLAPTNAELQNAFAAIGDSLANLRISQ